MNARKKLPRERGARKKLRARWGWFMIVEIFSLSYILNVRIKRLICPNVKCSDFAVTVSEVFKIKSWYEMLFLNLTHRSAYCLLATISSVFLFINI